MHTRDINYGAVDDVNGMDFDPRIREGSEPTAEECDAGRFSLTAHTAWRLEARARARVHALLREEVASDELQRLLAEGAKMSEVEACRLALEN